MNDRGTGRTTNQMLAAPKGAMFVSCCTGAMNHDRDLARKIGRSDLYIVGPDIFNNDGERLRGKELTGFVVDHAMSEIFMREGPTNRYAEYRRVMSWIGTRIRK